MNQAEGQNKSSSSPQSNPAWIVWLIAGALVVGCACSLGALLLLRGAGNLDWIRSRWPLGAATATPQAAAPSPTTSGDLPTPLAAATSTPTAAPTATATGTATQTVPPTHTAAPLPTETEPPAATPSPTPPPQASPTPFTCDSLYELAGIQLAPGQTFNCTLHEEELTELANNYPDSPCSQTRFTLDDGEIGVECRMGLRMQATLVAETENCRLELEVVRGTVGFKQIVQELIATQFDVIQYDTICIDQIEIDDGAITLAGYGR